MIYSAYGNPSASSFVTIVADPFTPGANVTVTVPCDVCSTFSAVLAGVNTTLQITTIPIVEGISNTITGSQTLISTQAAISSAIRDLKASLQRVVNVALNYRSNVGFYTDLVNRIDNQRYGNTPCTIHPHILMYFCLYDVIL